jgi:hypothetical protein
VISDRSVMRSRLRRQTADAFALQRSLVAVLRADGKTWRQYERASKGEAQRLVTMARTRLIGEDAAALHYYAGYAA